MQDQLSDYEKDIVLAQKAQSNVVSHNYASSMFSNQNKQNLVEWELDFSQELADIERLLRCDVIGKDEEGNERWMENPDKSKVFINNLGVSDIIRKIRLVVNKGKVLANYNIEEIRKRVGLLEHELRVLIYNNYEEYGMDNDYKQNNYSMVVLTIGTLIEDCYRRAMNGEGHKGLNEQRLVTQTEPLSQGYFNQPQQTTKKVHWYNPASWGR